MRRYVPYIALAIALPILFSMPLIYQNWSKVRREKIITEALQDARQLDGLSPEAALAQLTNAPQSTVTILYTGNTQGNLEPCGCYVGQSGGVARRATVVEQFRAKGLHPLLVDAGGWMDAENSENELERLKFQTYLTAMAQIGYTAISPSSQDFHWGADFLFKVLQDNNLPVLLTVSEFGTEHIQPYQLVKVEGTSVALLGASNMNASAAEIKTGIQKAVTSVSNQADVVVLLSSLPPALEEQIAQEVEGIDLIISASERKTQTIGKTLLVGSVSGGKMLGFAQWGGGDTWKTGQITMTEEVPEHPDVQARVQAFYQRIADDPKFQGSTKRLFATERLESEPHNSFVGSDTCRDCHKDVYAQWETTSHAAAYHTLLQAQRHFYPECVSCHVTGSGYETGFQIGVDERQHLAGVGCETCHGPGRSHVSNPKKTNVRAKVDTALCQQCHSEEHHPGFLQVAQHLRPKVNHTETIGNIKELLAHRSQLPGKVEVELFVMSFCPYGVKAEEQLIPILRQFADKVDFKLRFIANEVEKGPSPFEAPHGIAELEENIRQAVIAAYEPAKLYDYLLCRAKHLKGSWETCAQKVGLDVGRIQRIAQSPEAEALFRKNIQRTKELKVGASPTLYVDGRQFSRELFTKSAKGACGL